MSRSGSVREKADDRHACQAAMTPARPSQPETAGKGGGSRGRLVAIAALLVAMTAAVYGQTAGHSFITFDDEAYVAQNPRVGQGLTGSGVIWAFSTTWMGNYHPVTWLSHMADVTLFGMNPGPHHLVNVVFHILNAVFLFHVLVRMTGAVAKSAFVAALFAVHPLHVESVAWIAERKDVLSAFFFIMTLEAYVSFVERRTAGRYAVVVAAATLGLLAKPMLVTLPFVLLLLDYWPLRRFAQPAGAPPADPASGAPLTPGAVLLEKLPLAALSAAACAVAAVSQSAAGATDIEGVYPFGFRLANGLISYGTYLVKTFWPASLAVYYPYPSEGLAAWKIAAAGTAVLSITAFAIVSLRRRPFLAAGWFWYLGMLFPVIGLVQVGEQAMADRYTYLPLVGIAIALVWGVSEPLSGNPFRSRLLGAAGGAAIAVMAVLAWIQAGYWRNSATLYRHALEVTTDNWMMHNNLGVIRAREGRADEALRHFAESVRIQPNFALSQFNLGEAVLVGGNLGGSVRYLERAVALAPENAVMRLVLGKALARLGRSDEALYHLREAARLDPADVEIQLELGMLQATRGRLPGR